MAGALGVAPVDGLVSPAYVVAAPFEEANAAYYAYLFRTAAYMREVNKFSHGIVADRNRLYWDEFKQMPSLVPPRVEQDQIVAYLRAQDAHIARLIISKQKLISLFEEQKHSVIHNALTGNLSNNQRTPSGVDWIGEIPAHWQVISLRQISKSLQTGPFGSQLHAEDYSSGGTPVINPSHLKNGTIVPDNACAVGHDVVQRLRRHMLKPGDLVFARRGELGRCALVTETEAGWLCGTGSLKAELKPNTIDNKFLMLALGSAVMRSHLRLHSVGATMENANASIIGNIKLPFPPINEQFTITTTVEHELQPIHDAIERINAEIKLLREYRDRLIADVVTGQIDVRGWVPGPDDVVAEEDLSALGDDVGSSDEDGDEGGEDD